MSEIYLLRVLSLIWEFRFNVSGVNTSRVSQGEVGSSVCVCVGGGGGAVEGLGLPAGGICASQGTFSSFVLKQRLWVQVTQSFFFF